MNPNALVKTTFEVGGLYAAWAKARTKASLAQNNVVEAKNENKVRLDANAEANIDNNAQVDVQVEFKQEMRARSHAVVGADLEGFNGVQNVNINRMSVFNDNGVRNTIVLGVDNDNHLGVYNEVRNIDNGSGVSGFYSFVNEVNLAQQIDM